MFVARSIFAALLTASIFMGATSQVTAQEKKAVRGTPIARPAKPTNTTPAEVTKPTPATPAIAAVAPAPSNIDPDFKSVSFDLLANYTFEVPDGVISTNKVGESASQIPADVRALNGKKVALKGFMLPLKVDNGLVTELLIMKDQSMCCYGAVPRINDWVSVKMAGKGVPSVMDQAVTLFGKLRVGEVLENGYLVAIYQMDAEKMVEDQ